MTPKIVKEAKQDFTTCQELTMTAKLPAELTAYTTPHLWQAKQFAALRVATHKYVAQARVIDIDSQVMCYAVNNPLLARADLISWGGVRLELPARVVSYLNDTCKV